MDNYHYDETAWLHVYPQYSWHCDASIVGTRNGLLALRAAIDAALSDDHGHYAAQVFANDGESYEVNVAVILPAEMLRMATAYTDESACGSAGMQPHHLPRKPRPLPTTEAGKHE